MGDADYVYEDAQGNPYMRVRRHEPGRYGKPKNFSQERYANGRWKPGLDGLVPIPYKLPELLAADVAKPIFVVEGEKDVDRLYGEGFIATTNPMGAGKWEQIQDLTALKDRQVVIIPDNDDRGRRHADDVAESLQGVASSVRILQLEALPERGDVSDWLDSGGTASALAELAENCPEWRPPIPSEKPSIVVTGRFLHDITDEAIEALVRANRRDGTPRYYSYADGLARLRRSDNGGFRIELLKQASLAGVLDREAIWLRAKDGETKPARPAKDAIADLLSLPDLPLPILNAVYSVPVFTPQGLLCRDGYDTQSGIYIHKVGLQGVRTDVPLKEAVSLLEEVFCNFPFVEKAGFVHTIALLLQPFLRPLVDGPTPLYLIEAHQMATGKTLLAKIVSLVATGREAYGMVLPRSEEELEKRVTALLLEGSQLVLIDNVDRRLESASLSSVTTAKGWKGRTLGKTETVTVPNQCTWIATGNNVELSGELARRIVPILLDAAQDHPEDRTGFRHPNITSWVMEKRTPIVSACLSLIQKWWDEGQPKGNCTFGSFESWAGTMGGILALADIGGFLSSESRERLWAGVQSEDMEWATLCRECHKRYGDAAVPARDALKVAKELELLLEVWGGRGEKGTIMSMGRALRKNEGRIFGGYRFRRAGDDPRTNNNRYIFESLPRRGEEETTETTETTECGQETRMSQDLQNNGKQRAEIEKQPLSANRETVVPGVSVVSELSQPSISTNGNPAVHRKAAPDGQESTIDGHCFKSDAGALNNRNEDEDSVGHSR